MDLRVVGRGIDKNPLVTFQYLIDSRIADREQTAYDMACPGREIAPDKIPARCRRRFAVILRDEVARIGV